MTGKEISDFVDEVVTSEEFDIIINETNNKLANYINNKIKSVENKIKTDTEHLLIRSIISHCVEATIGYEISYGFGNYINENNVVYFDLE